MSGPTHLNIFGLFLAPCRHWYVSRGIFCQPNKKPFYFIASFEEKIFLEFNKT